MVLVTKQSNLIRIFTIIVGCFIIYGVVKQYRVGTRNIKIQLEGSIDRHSFVLDCKHPDKLLEKATSNDRVLYLNAIPMLFHLVNGAWQLGAIYSPVIDNTASQSYWLSRFEYIVGWNRPLLEITKHRGILSLDDISSVAYQATTKEDSRKLELFVSNPDNSFKIKLVVPSSNSNLTYKSDFEFNVPANYSGWLSLNDKLPIVPVKTFQLIPVKVNDKAELCGLRFKSNNEEILWPWKQQATITIDYKYSEPVSAKFDIHDVLSTDKLQDYFESSPEELQMLYDGGSLVLLHLGMPSSDSGTMQQ